MTARESIGRTLMVATIVALTCSLLVSIAVYWLRPIQIAMQSIERNRAVLVAAGLAGPTETLEDAEVIDRFLNVETRLADLDAANFVTADANMAAAYDYRAAADDPDARRDIDPERDTASLGARPFLMPVYLIESGGQIDRIVLPVYGRGMWSTIHGYIALERDFVAIADVWFYEHGETPGIGDRILNSEWLRSWRGKRAYSPDGVLELRVGGPDDSAALAQVDGITGATVTVAGLDTFVRYWLGEDGYGPLLSRLRERS